MFFTLLLGLSALMVAGAAAYFSVLGIATLFAGSYYQVMIMAGSLEFGKLVAASYLHRFWNKTSWWLKGYLCVAVIALMAITSIGIFGYLSAAYQVNSAKFGQIDNEISLIQSQQDVLVKEIEQNNKRVEMLNEIRKTQEKRVEEAGNYKVPREQAYAAIDKANQELNEINTKNQTLREKQFQKDNEIIELKAQISKAKDIGTFKFFADFINKPLDSVVIWFIVCLIFVFDPLAVSLVLAFNTVVSNKTKTVKNKEKAVESDVQETTDSSTSDFSNGLAKGYPIPKK